MNYIPPNPGFDFQSDEQFESDRRSLLNKNIEGIETQYLKAVTAGEAAPVVLVLDLDDTVGYLMGTRMAGEEYLTSSLEKLRDAGLVPVLIGAGSREETAGILTYFFGQAAGPLLLPASPGQFHVSVVSKRGLLNEQKRIPD